MIAGEAPVDTAYDSDSECYEKNIEESVDLFDHSMVWRKGSVEARIGDVLLIKCQNNTYWRELAAEDISPGGTRLLKLGN